MYLSLESINWRPCFYVSYWRRGRHFYVLIRAKRRSSRLQGKGSTFISQLFLIRHWELIRPFSGRTRLLPPCSLALLAYRDYYVVLVSLMGKKNI